MQEKEPGDSEQEIDETAPMGGALGGGLVEWQKPEWASTLHVPLELTRLVSRASSHWEDGPELPTLTTLEAAVPWEWQGGPSPPKSPRC